VWAPASARRMKREAVGGGSAASPRSVTSSRMSLIMLK
jgi:hypothetical protein